MNDGAQQLLLPGKAQSRLPAEVLYQLPHRGGARRFACRVSAHPIANHKKPSLEIVSEAVFIVRAFAPNIGQRRDFDLQGGLVLHGRNLLSQDRPAYGESAKNFWTTGCETSGSATAFPPTPGREVAFLRRKCRLGQFQMGRVNCGPL